MKTLILVAHPDIENSTTQKFFQTSLVNFDDVTYHPISIPINIEEEQQLLRSNDRIIFQFPLFWYSAPALLKTWQDEVLSTSFINSPSLKGKELGIVVTTGSAKKDFGAGNPEKFTISEILRPYEAMANKAMMSYLPPLPVYQFLYMESANQQRLLVAYQQYVTNPNFSHFNGQVSWFKEQLQKKITTQDPERTSTLETILDTISQNQEELDDLRWNLDQIKKDDDN